VPKQKCHVTGHAVLQSDKMASRSVLLLRHWSVHCFLVLVWTPVMLQQCKRGQVTVWKWPCAKLQSARCWCRDRSTVLATEDSPLQRRITKHSISRTVSIKIQAWC